MLRPRRAPVPSRTTPENRLRRFWSKVLVGDGCWEWTGAKNKGYGHLSDGGRTVGAHRVAYEMLIGPIPDAHEVDHLCLNKACVNPAHLEPVPYEGRENTRRHYALTTHCRNGHAYTVDNTYFDRHLHRSCRACRREALARFYARRAA